MVQKLTFHFTPNTVRCQLAKNHSVNTVEKKLSERGDTYYLTKSMAVRGFEKLCDEFDKKKTRI